MPQYSQTFGDLIKRVLHQRGGINDTLVRGFLNERMRAALDYSPMWSGLIQRTTLSLPQAYSTGVIEFINGSQVGYGIGTNWPVSDLINAVIVEGIPAPGQFWVTVAPFTNVNVNTVLYVDAGGMSPEIVAVQDIRAGRCLCVFQYPHNSNSTATMSSLANLQIRFMSVNPVFSIYAVTSPTLLIMDSPWAGPTNYTSSPPGPPMTMGPLMGIPLMGIPLMGSISIQPSPPPGSPGLSYEILLMYTTFAPNVKDLLVVTDAFQQIPLRLHVSQQEADLTDPNRTATDSPNWIIDLGPNLNGNMLYEVYPPQDDARQLYVMYYQQWPDMRLPWDRPPSFMDPNILIYGALADAFRTPCPKQPDGKDPYFNLDAANYYDTMFTNALYSAWSADQSKAQQAYQWNYKQVLGGGGFPGGNFAVTHDWDLLTGNF